MPSAPNTLDLIVDIERNRLLSSFTSSRAAAAPVFRRGDTIPVTVRCVRASTADPDLPFEEIDLTNQNVRLALGSIAADPSAGTWTITASGSTTNALAANAPAVAVQYALNTLGPINSNGNCTVSAFSSGGYRVTFNNDGDRSNIAFSAETDSLYPSTDARFYDIQTGNSTAPGVKVIQLEQAPAATANFATTLDSAAVTIATTRQGVTDTTSEIQTLLLDPAPYGGTFTVTTPLSGTASSPIDHDASAASLQSAIIATDSTNLTSNVTVTGTSPGPWSIEFASSLGNIAPLTADVTGLDVPTGRQGDLDLTGGGLVEFLAGANSKQATFEVEILNTVSSTSWTPLQTVATVQSALQPS